MKSDDAEERDEAEECDGYESCNESSESDLGCCLTGILFIVAVVFSVCFCKGCIDGVSAAKRVNSAERSFLGTLFLKPALDGVHEERKEQMFLPVRWGFECGFSMSR